LVIRTVHYSSCTLLLHRFIHFIPQNQRHSLPRLSTFWITPGALLLGPHPFSRYGLPPFGLFNRRAGAETLALPVQHMQAAWSDELLVIKRQLAPSEKNIIISGISLMESTAIAVPSSPMLHLPQTPRIRFQHLSPSKTDQPKLIIRIPHNTNALTSPSRARLPSQALEFPNSSPIYISKSKSGTTSKPSTSPKAQTPDPSAI